MKKKMHPQAERYIAERAQGRTYQQIAEKYGVSYQAVQQCCARRQTYAFRPFTKEKIVYPGLRKWMNENRVSIAELIRRAGLVPYANTRDRYASYLSGRNEPSKKVIDTLLGITGLSYEELFREEKNGN